MTRKTMKTSGLNLKVGQTLPVHKNENSSLILFVLNGSGEIRINEEQEKVEKGTVLYAKGEDDFSISIVTDLLSLLVNITPNPYIKYILRSFKR